MYLDGGMEKISEPRVILREGRLGTILELKQRKPLIALLSDSKVPLYASIIAKNESLIFIYLFIFRKNVSLMMSEETEKEGIVQRNTDGKNTSVCAGVCGVRQINRAETER